MDQNEGLVYPIKNEVSHNIDYSTHAAYENLSSGNNSFKTNSLAQSVTSGPVVENIKDQSLKTQADLSNLAATRTTPTSTTATGQPLTQYHSFFYSLLSWDHPRASGIAYIATILCIFAVRYLNVIRYSLKVTYVLLGITVLAEVVGKLLFAHGFTTQIRPRKYYTVSRETLNLLIGDLHELINFFFIQAQQIIFAENLPVSIAAFASAFISYFLVKFIPLWGLSLLGTTFLFLGTLTYKTNQELIDHYIEQTSQILEKQTENVKTLASKYATRATTQTRALVGDYSAKAHEMISSTRSPLSSPRATSKTTKVEPSATESKFQAEDFPKAPVEDLKIINDSETLRQDQNLISA